MRIRRAVPSDLAEITSLFYETITRINARDYTPAQIEVWAENAKNTEGWLKRIAEQYFYVANSENAITGFASMSDTGYVDLLYVHYAHQSQGIARMLLSALEADAKALQISLLTVDVSITARPFFESRGFFVDEEEERLIRNVSFRNFKMKKKLAQSHLAQRRKDREEIN